MINTKNLSKMDREYIKLKYGSVKEYKKIKLEKEAQEQKLLQIDEKIKTRQVLDSYFERIKADAEQQQIIKYKNDIKETMCKFYSNQYNKWLVVYDLLNSSYYEIKKAVNKNKITIEDIKEVINNCNSIHNIFNLNDTLQFVQ